MHKIPYELKLIFIIAVALVLGFVVFIILLTMVYKKRQSEFLIQKKLSETTAHNALLQKDLEKLQALQSERERISMDMHDELGSGLSRIKLLTEMLTQKTEHLENKQAVHEIKENAVSLTSTMRELVWTLNPQNDHLDNMVLYLKHLANTFFEQSEIQCRISLPDNIPEAVLSGFARRNIILCFKEIMNNCFKHAQASVFEVIISCHNNHLQIQCSDNGIGMPTEQKSGNGLRHIQKRMQDIQGVFIQLPSTIGSIIKLQIPFQLTE